MVFRSKGRKHTRQLYALRQSISVSLGLLRGENGRRSILSCSSLCRDLNLSQPFLPFHIHQHYLDPPDNLGRGSNRSLKRCTGCAQSGFRSTLRSSSAYKRSLCVASSAPPISQAVSPSRKELAVRACPRYLADHHID